MSDAERERDGESGAAARLTGNGNLATVGLDDGLADRKAKASATGDPVAGAGFVRAEKTVEDVGRVLRRNADARVAYAQPRDAGNVIALELDGHLFFGSCTRGAKLDGIIEQVADDLPQVMPIARHGDGGQFPDSQVDTVVVSYALKHLDNAAYDLVERNRLRVGLQSPGVRFGQEQELVDQRLER
jgi:hypothetical protein